VFPDQKFKQKKKSERNLLSERKFWSLSLNKSRRSEEEGVKKREKKNKSRRRILRRRRRRRRRRSSRRFERFY